MEDPPGEKMALKGHSPPEDKTGLPGSCPQTLSNDVGGAGHGSNVL